MRESLSVRWLSSVALVVFALLSCLPAHADTTTGLRLYYCFEASAVKDCSGKNNNGEAIGDVSLVPGKIGTAARFGGFQSLGYIHVPNTSSMNLGAKFTLAYWVKLDGYAGEDAYHNLVDYGTHVPVAKSHDQNGFFSVVNPGAEGGGAYAGIDYQEGVFVDATQPVVLDQWTHVVYTVDSSSGKVQVFINGELRKKMKVADIDLSVFNSADLYLGAQAPLIGENVYQYPLDGAIDDVRLYSRVLSASDVAELAAIGGICN